ncbi:MAG: dimethyl sulfoxide reductase anchor subunit [Pseudomonadota bacterium]|nr:dimethyl sulfoxide reductase anchor subunit [Pseudomonadota bacterium]
MNPALSVLFFSTLSGAGYGLLFWTALLALTGGSRPQPFSLLVAMLVAMLLVSIGLLSSLFHLGKPQRAWRALSQWRTSWLSREGVAAVATYVPALLLTGLLWLEYLDPTSFVFSGRPALLVVAVCVGLAACAMLTVACTAMIYASLKPIPAWRHRSVLPSYLLFSLCTGGLLVMALSAQDVARLGLVSPLVAMALLILLLLTKWRYWRDMDGKPLPATRGDAIGLPQRTATVFERPHTEANYITREMAFGVARAHARKLRLLAMVLFGVLPLVSLLPTLVFGQMDETFCLSLGALSALAGAFVERWLFFAEAKHTVTLYY